MDCHRLEGVRHHAVQEPPSRRLLCLHGRGYWYVSHPFTPYSLSAHHLYEKAGQDATEAFYGLHRHEIIVKPQYTRLQIGTLKDEQPAIYGRVDGALSNVPYGEPTWLSKGFKSPYYKEVRRSRSCPPLDGADTRMSGYRATGSCRRQCTGLWMSMCTTMLRYALSAS